MVHSYGGVGRSYKVVVRTVQYEVVVHTVQYEVMVRTVQYDVVVHTVQYEVVVHTVQYEVVVRTVQYEVVVRTVQYEVVVCTVQYEVVVRTVQYEVVVRTVQYEVVVWTLMRGGAYCPVRGCMYSSVRSCDMRGYGMHGPIGDYRMIRHLYKYSIQNFHGKVFAHGSMRYRVDPSWWSHRAISGSSQCSMTGVCAILSVEYKRTLAANWKE